MSHNLASFDGICEVCNEELGRTFEVEDFLRFIEAHSGHGANGRVITLQSFSVFVDDDE